MIRQIKHQPGQSVYDLCNQAYGTLDYLIKFCKDNNITNLAELREGEFYSFDTDLVLTQGQTYAYATAVDVLASTCPLITGLFPSSVGTDAITFVWTATEAGAYQWAYNETGDTPTSGAPTTSNTRTLTGLTSDTEYHFFVRNVCADGTYSAWATVSVNTELAPPAPPVVDGLIVQLMSSIGVTESGGFVSLWEDQSGSDNHVEPETNSPLLVPGVFGAQPAIRFGSVDSDRLVTDGDMVNLAGEDACTIFIVAKGPNPVTGKQFISYSDNPGGLAAGEIEIYYQRPSGTNQYNAQSRGNVFFNTTVANTDTNAHAIYVIQDFSATSELIGNTDNVTFWTPIGTSNNSNTFAAAPLYVGAQICDIGCVLIYRRVLTGVEINDTMDWLKTTYAI